MKDKKNYLLKGFHAVKYPTSFLFTRSRDPKEIKDHIRLAKEKLFDTVLLTAKIGQSTLLLACISNLIPIRPY